MSRFAFAVVCVVASTTPARADLLRSTLDQPIEEVAHTVDIRVADGVATYTVRRTFRNSGRIADEAALAIDLPYGAAATGLRIRARDRWYAGELMEREAAAQLYQELTGMGAFAPKDPALLQWLWADKLYLQVFPIFPGKTSTVEYTLTVPTRYASGRYWLSYPYVDAAATLEPGARKLVRPAVSVTTAWNARAEVAIAGARVGVGARRTLVPPVQPAWLDAVDVSERASYVSSIIDVPARTETEQTFSKVKIHLDVRHTYKGDLRLALISPSGKSVEVFDGSGGSENDIRGAVDVDVHDTIGAGRWRLVASDHAALDTGTLDRWKLTLGTATFAAKDTPVFIPDAQENASDAGIAAITVTPPAIATWQARLGHVAASAKHAFARLEVDTAPQLVPLPKRAQVVFVIDASYSVGPELLDGQLEIAKAYASHVPDAEVEIVAYRRRASRVFGRFVRANQLPAAIDAAKRRGAFALGNGSAIDEGARLAATTLAGRAGELRVVMMTDDLVRGSLSDEDALAALAALDPRTVVHVVSPVATTDAAVSLRRDDDAALAPLATKHRGIYARVAGPLTLRKLVPTVLELVRPTRIEKLVAPGFDLDDDVLREGDGLRVWQIDSVTPTSVELAGVLWSDPVRLRVDAAGAFSAATAAFVFGEDHHHELDDAEMMKVAIAGRAVSPVTSYVAFEPGTRPSPIGIPHRGTFGMGRFATVGVGALSHATRPRNLRPLIDPAPCLRAHPPNARWDIELLVLTTRDEIVDVQVKRGAGPLASCLVEATWAVRLTPDYTARYGEVTVEFSGPERPVVSAPPARQP